MKLVTGDIWVNKSNPDKMVMILSQTKVLASGIVKFMLIGSNLIQYEPLGMFTWEYILLNSDE